MDHRDILSSGLLTPRERSHLGWWLVFIVIFLIACALWSLWRDRKEEQAWQQFATEQHCRVIGEMWNPRKIGYICDDGKTYWR